MQLVRRTRTRIIAVLSCLAVAVAVAPAAVAAPTAAAPTVGPATAQAGPTAEVTLLTGDTVTVISRPGGTPAVTMRPAEGAAIASSFTTLRQGDDVYVVPDEVAHLVPDVLDLELFNVTGLVEMGYGDSATDTLPVIVQGAAPLAAVGARPLPSIGATAMNLPKHGGFATTLAAGADTKVWLDRKVRASELDPNLTQIGAPEVWDSGLSGTGVDVAVLDTGVDGTHPDLVGKVATEANFTEAPTAADGHGHGTHVASVIGGTGAAAGGARKGVAFGARLLSGKVLGDDGSGQWSWVVAGMEWAVAQGADVVNMSLGGSAGDGDDPVAQALDALTASTGTLFVVAAGNDGPGAGSIDTPGIAASALTVGAVIGDGRPVMFSGNGPTRGTYRAKPDLTAPGVNITGARAGGGEPYTEMTGTSQATPHVAGAAALLREQHPDWDWQRIKTTLMMSADAKVPDLMPNAEGAGLLDLPGATTETLRVSHGAVDFGYLRYPDGSTPRTIEVTLTNDGTQPETVELTDSARNVFDEPAPEDLVTVSPAEVTVAPGASERVTVTLTPANGEPGVYSGAVTLAREGKDSTTLPLSFYAEAPRHDVSLTVLNRRGEPYAGGTVWLGNMQEMHPRTGGGFTIVQLDENGRGTARVAPGPFSMVAKIETPEGGGQPASLAFAGSPEVMVDKDISYTIDARKTRQLKPATVEGVRTKVSSVSVHYAHEDAARGGSLGDAIYAPQEVADGQIYLQPTKPVRYGQATFETRWALEGSKEIYELVLDGPAVADPPVYRVTRAQARKLARLDADYRTLGGAERDDYLEVRAPFTERVNSAFAFWRKLPAPARRVELVTARPDVAWQHCLAGPNDGVAVLCEPTTPYRQGERRSPVWFRAPAPAVISGMHFTDQIALPVALSDGEHIGSVWNFPAAGNRTLRLFRNGVELTRREDSDYFLSPPEPATFRLEHTSTPDQNLLPIGRSTSTSWTFPSAASTDPDQSITVPRLLSVDYQPETDARGRLAPYRMLSMGVRVVSTQAASVLRLERGSLRFWASTDQGKRWHWAIVFPRGDGTYQVLVPGVRPRPGELVSVRAEATAAEGRKISQTIVDAYPVR